MSNQYFNFYYDPVRQGYDTSSWRTLFGSPNVSGTRLNLPYSTVIHYADILRGDATFSMYISAPAVGHDRKFGFTHYNKNAYARFSISNTSFTAECSDGVTSKTAAITWQTAWSNVNTEFRIKWEAGMVSFYVAGNLQAVIDEDSIKSTGSDDSHCVPGDPMSIYLSNMSSDSVFLNYINIKSIQSYLMSEGNDDSAFGPMLYEIDTLSITEVITMETFGMSPSASLSPSSSYSPSSSDSRSISPSLSLSPSSSDSPSSSYSPSSSLSRSLSPSSSESKSLSPSASSSKSYSPSSSASNSLSPSSSTSRSQSPSSSLSPSSSISPSPGN